MAKKEGTRGSKQRGTSKLTFLGMVAKKTLGFAAGGMKKIGRERKRREKIKKKMTLYSAWSNHDTI